LATLLELEGQRRGAASGQILSDRHVRRGQLLSDRHAHWAQFLSDRDARRVNVSLIAMLVGVNFFLGAYEY
jgi:hypothetical protein